MHCKPSVPCLQRIFRETPLTQAARASPLALESLERLWVYSKHMRSFIFAVKWLLSITDSAGQHRELVLGEELQ